MLARAWGGACKLIMAGVGVCMSVPESGSLQREGAEALRLMEDALALLDRCGAHSGAHLDLAICRLRDELANEKTAATRRQP